MQLMECRTNLMHIPIRTLVHARTHYTRRHAHTTTSTLPLSCLLQSQSSAEQCSEKEKEKQTFGVSRGHHNSVPVTNMSDIS